MSFTFFESYPAFDLKTTPFFEISVSSLLVLPERFPPAQSWLGVPLLLSQFEKGDQKRARVLSGLEAPLLKLFAKMSGE